MNTTKTRVTRQREQTFNDVSSDCICQRPQTNLICIDCRRRLFGRLHKVCEKHPTLVYLYDLGCCPCGGRFIEAITEAKNGFM